MKIQNFRFNRKYKILNLIEIDENTKFYNFSYRL